MDKGTLNGNIEVLFCKGASVNILPHSRERVSYQLIKVAPMDIF